MMVWILGKGKKISAEKAFKMAIIHDIGKILTGDITPDDGLFPKNKKRER